MGAEKSFAIVANEAQEVGFLRVVQRQLAGRVEQDRVERVEVLAGLHRRGFLGDQAHIGTQRDVEQSRFRADIAQSDHGMGNRLMGPAFAVADDEKMLEGVGSFLSARCFLGPRRLG